MPRTFLGSLGRRGLVGVAPVLVAGCLLAGCGGSSGGSTHRGFPGGIRPIGPANLTANVTGLMKTNQPYLGGVHAHCPSGPITHFPVSCHFTATEVKPPPGFNKSVQSNRRHPHQHQPPKQKFPGPYPVVGTITVMGVYFRTKTYEYALDYVPLH